MSIKAWADSARQDKYRQTTEHQRAIETFQGLLEGNTTPNTAADAISSLYEPLIKRDPSPVATLWGILCEAVRALGGHKDHTERLVSLLISISQLPDVTDKYGNAITPEWKSAGVYWRDLPELSMIFREYAIDIEPEDEMEGNWDDQAMPLLNATTFGAMYFARGRQPSIGMSFHAEVSLMQGIEVPYQMPNQQRLAAMYIPPAATWILLAGERIYELCKSDHGRKDGAPGSTPNEEEWLWGKGRGFSLGRWALWKERFDEIARTQGLQNGVKELSARANSEMGKLESQTYQ